MLFRRLLLALLGLSALRAPSLLAYPNTIGLGYQSCLSCHYNPYGNGPLTDYGRALSATEISDRLMWKDALSEDEVADRSGFLVSPPENTWLRPSLSYRSLFLMKDYGGDAAENEFFIMDASAAVVAKFLDRDRLIFVGQIGYSPRPGPLEDVEGVKTYRSREHYVGYRFNKEWGLYAGLMDKVYGLRVPDHIAYSRMMTGLTQFDQTHGALLHYVGESFELGVQPFVGNLVQKEKLRQKGVSAQIEVGMSEKSRLGFSALSSRSEYLETVMGAVHTRVGIGKGHSVLAEIGQVEKKVRATGTPTEGRYLFVQPQVMLRRGLSTLLTVEAKQADLNKAARTYRVGPGLQFFPFQRVELRADAYHSMQRGSSKDRSSWDLTAQLHLWL